MANTFIKIASVTVGAGGSATIGFTSIPSTYTDLCVKWSGRGDNGSARDAYISFNGVTTGFTYRSLVGSGSAASSANASNGLIGIFDGSVPTASTFSNGEFYIPNYTASTNKSISGDSVTENNGTAAYAYLTATLSTNTSAITSITLTPDSGNFVQYSTATLYGIKNS
jgi:hypothetical protein